MSAAFRSVFNVARTARVAPVAVSARSVAFARPAFVYRSYSAATGLSHADIHTRVIDVLKSFEKIDHAKIHPAASFAEDLGLDSLDAVEAVMAIEEEFSIEIPDAEADEIKTVQQAIDYIAKTPEARDRSIIQKEMSTTIAAAASRKVFETPELLSLICNYANHRTRMRILRANKSGFLSAAPFVWKKVDGVVHLLKLLPRLQIVNDKSNKIEKITLQPLSQADYSRFEFYAPFVKILELYKGDSFFEISGWRILSLRTAQGPLLPNLSSLTASLSIRSTACHTQGLMWITSLLSPSLKRVRLIGAEQVSFPIHSAIVGSTILEGIARICPGIQTLSLFPFTGSGESDEEHFLLNLLPGRSFVQYLPALHDLSELETSMTMVRPEAFAQLGALPRLKRLSLYSTPAEPVIDPKILSENAFPALTHLALKGLRDTEVKMVLSLLPLIRNVTSLEVTMALGEGEGRWIVDEFFPRLENMTHLTDLSASFDEESLLGDFQDINCPQVLNALAKLPLRTISLSGVDFQDDVDFTKVLPAVTKLSMISQYTSPERLPCFATIPKLEHLFLVLDLDDEDRYPSQDSVPSCPSLHTIEISSASFLVCRPRWMCKTAELLLILFPNIKQVVMSPKLRTLRPIENAGVVWLNSQIDMQRELKRLRSRIVDKYGQDEADSLIPKSFPADVFKNR